MDRLENKGLLATVLLLLGLFLLGYYGADYKTDDSVNFIESREFSSANSNPSKNFCQVTSTESGSDLYWEYKFDNWSVRVCR